MNETLFAEVMMMNFSPNGTQTKSSLQIISTQTIYLILFAQTMVHPPVREAFFSH